MQDDIQKGAMDAQFAVILDQAELLELVQKEDDPGPGGADHKGVRTDLAITPASAPC